MRLQELGYTIRKARRARGLTQAQQVCVKGEKNAEKLAGILRKEINSSQPARVDYVEIVSQEKLEPIAVVDRPAVMAVAVYYGNTRLIDNLLLP